MPVERREEERGRIYHEVLKRDDSKDKKEEPEPTKTEKEEPIVEVKLLSLAPLSSVMTVLPFAAESEALKEYAPVKTLPVVVVVATSEEIPVSEKVAPLLLPLSVMEELIESLSVRETAPETRSPDSLLLKLSVDDTPVLSVSVWLVSVTVVESICVPMVRLEV